METYKNQFIYNCLVTIKIDGVQAIKKDGMIVSRNGKPLYNIPDFDGERAEIFTGSFKDTISKVKSKNKTYNINQEEIFKLAPEVDKRLIIATTSVDVLDVSEYMEDVLAQGHEGLVLTDLDTGKQYKVKKTYTEDVKIDSLIEGKGRLVGKLGAFMTSIGKVGTGFTDKEREEYFNEDLIGTYIEVEGMEKLPSGKMRHPRFIRMREDK